MKKNNVTSSEINPKFLMIDNYDSFTYNLVQLFRSSADIELDVIRNDAKKFSEIDFADYSGIIISPGPGKPSNLDLTNQIIRELYKVKPIFGVCLGMQCINEVFGGKTVKAPYPIHGKVDTITHTNRGIFKNIKQDLKIARYHSLMTKINSEEIVITATNSDGITMGIEHKEYPVYGVQFHPESFLTECGNIMASNFISICKKQPDITIY
jgi:anthranilate synthase/aminodeoxychorismate synthase-like glutamine amidotransferase